MTAAHRFIDRRRLNGFEDPDRLAPKSYSRGLYQTPTNTGDGDFYRPRQWWSPDPADCLGYEREELLGYSRRLFAQMGELGAAIVQKATYAVGDAWKPQYKGTNKKWGDEAEEWLHHAFLPNCDLRGSVFDLATQLFLSSIAYDVDGDDAVIFTDDGDTGFPKLKFVDSTMVGSGRSSAELKEGRYDGAKIKDGIICDRRGTMVGMRLIGDGDKHLDVSVAEGQFHFEPEWRSPYRGIPRIARVTLDWCSLQDIDHYLKLMVKQDSSLGVMVHNETGRADASRDFISARDGTASATNPSDIRRETVMGGQFWYLKAGTSEKMEPFKSDRPSPNVEDFVRRIRRGGMVAIGWPFELLDPSAIGGASVRLIQDQARASVRARQKSILRRARRCVQYAIGTAMDRKFLSMNPDPDDFMLWDFERPAELTVDEGYSEQADRENLLLGSTTLSAVVQKKGRWWEDVRKQRTKENLDLVDRAAEIIAHAKTKHDITLTPREALDMMQRDGILQRQEPEKKTNAQATA
jgi:hypothetical protein